MFVKLKRSASRASDVVHICLRQTFVCEKKFATAQVFPKLSDNRTHVYHIRPRHTGITRQTSISLWHQVYERNFCVLLLVSKMVLNVVLRLFSRVTEQTGKRLWPWSDGVDGSHLCSWSSQVTTQVAPKSRKSRNKTAAGLLASPDASFSLDRCSSVIASFLVDPNDKFEHTPKLSRD